MNIEDIDQNLVDKVNDHIRTCGFGKILTISEDDDYVYFVHYGDNHHNINDIWINITSKKYLTPYSYEHYFFLEKKKNDFPFSEHTCCCDYRLRNCSTCKSKIIKHIREDFKLKCILMLG